MRLLQHFRPTRYGVRNAAQTIPPCDAATEAGGMSTRSPSAEWQTFRVQVSAPLPTLDEIERMPLAAIRALLVRIAGEQARLSALQAAIAARLSSPIATPADDAGLETEPALTLQEVAQALKKSTSWVRRAVRRGELAFARRVGRTLLFPAEGLRQYLARAMPCYEARSPRRAEGVVPRRGDRARGWRP